MRLGVLLAFCFAMLSVAGASAAGGAPVATGSHGAIAFWDAQHGLVGTGSPYCPAPCGRGTVSVTKDGGKKWTVVLKTQDAVSELDTAGRAAAWAVVQHCPNVTCDSHLWRTSNGGRTWSMVARGLNSVSFATPSAGLGVVNTQHVSRLLRSDTGGRSWRVLKAPCTGVTNLVTAVSLVTSNRGFVVCTGQASAGAESKRVFETGDGGRSWTMRSQAVLGNPNTTMGIPGYVVEIDVANSGYGLLCQLGSVLLLTRNNARTWEPLKLVRPRLDTCNAIATAPGVSFALIESHNRARLVTSTNGGRKWHLVKIF